MNRTFNRPPYTVRTPSSSDIKENYFNQNNWKGFVENKNFLNVDQESFEICNNVYVDDDGLLKSRPSFKSKNVIIKTKTGETTLAGIIRVWSFENVLVYLTENTDVKLTFVNDKFDTSVQISTTNLVKLLLVERKIFLFDVDSLKYYDLDTNLVYDSDVYENYVYVPVVKSIFKNEVTELESPNELTSSTITKYLFDSVEDVAFKQFVDKEVTVVIDETEYVITFSQYTQYVLVQQLIDVNFSIPQISNSKMNVSVSELGNMIFFELSGGKCQLYYSPDGMTYEYLEITENVVSNPVISDDGHCVAYLTNDDIKICKVLKDDGSDTLTRTWYSLLSTIDKDKHDLYKKEGLKFLHQSCLKIVTEDTFSVFCEMSDGYDCITCHIGTLNKCIISKPKLYESDYTSASFNTQMETGEYEYFSTLSGGTDHFKYSDENSPYYVKISFPTLKLTRIETFKYTISGTLEVALYDYNTDNIVRYKNAYVINETLEGSNVKVFLKDIVSINVYTSSLHPYNTVSITMGANKLWFDLNYPLYKAYPLSPDSDCHSVLEYDVPKVNVELYSDSETFNVILNTSQICLITSPTQNRVNYALEVNYVGQNAGININKDKFFFMDYNTEYGLSLNYANIEKFILKKEIVQYVNFYVPENFNKDSYITLVSPSGNVLTEEYLIFNNTSAKLLFKAKPLYFRDTTMYLYKDGSIYTNLLTKLISVNVLEEGEYLPLLPDYVVELNNFYIGIGNKIYISSYHLDENFKWYLPKINTNTMDYDISNLHVISSTEVAVFTKHSIYYITNSYNNDKQRYEYYYYKSKAQVGCEKGSDIITTFDGKYTMFASERGMVAMSYQDFVASTEQTIDYVSDSINAYFANFNDSPLKLLKYNFWIFCYKKGNKEFLLYDTRNQSWWPMTLPYEIEQLVVYDTPMLLSNNSLFDMSKDSSEYYDLNGIVKTVIDWSFTSHRLHLNSPNYSKNISSIILTSVSDSMEDMHMDLILRNYRKRMHISDVDSFRFYIDGIRTYVKRLNYSKVNEFQYTLTSDVNDDVLDSLKNEIKKIPLSLSNITIKYKITGQVK